MRDMAAPTEPSERTDRPKDLLGGFAPLVVAAILALLVVSLVPSVAPEHIVSVPADEASEPATTSTTLAPTTTVAPAAPAETTVVP